LEALSLIGRGLSKKIVALINVVFVTFLLFSLPVFSNIVNMENKHSQSFVIQALYTTNIDGTYERVFKFGTYFYIIGVIRNILDEPITISKDKIIFKIVDEENQVVYEKCLNNDVLIQPYSYKTLKFRWNCPYELASWSEAGFRFVGKKFFARLIVENISREIGFYIDEFGIPRWLRNSIFFSPPSVSDNLPENLVKEFYRTIAKRAKELGIDCLHLARIHSFGYHEGNQPSTINYWFPASDSPYATYSTPKKTYLNIVNGDESSAQKLIKEIIDIIHKEGIRAKVYTDPVGMYAPDKKYWNWLNPFYISEFLKQGYIAVAHQHSSDPGWVRFEKGKEGLKIKRLDFFETKLGISDINYLAVETCHTGPSKLGMKEYGNSSIPGYDPVNPDFDYGFYPEDILPDLNVSIKFDPSFHYEEVKQILWLSKNYRVDGISVDDTGRLIMGMGKAEYADDLWHNLICPALPSDPNNLYGVCYDEVYCSPLRELVNADKDSFTLNSYANMVKHMRWQVKYIDPNNFLISSDYLVPSDVGWKSIVASEDVSSTDHFDIWRSSFARWAYRTFQDGYRHLRTDLRRTLMPGLGSQSIIGLSNRPDLTLAIMIATSWSNNVNVEIGDPGNCRILSRDKAYWTNTEKIVYNYLRMKKEISYLFMEEAQQMLYHKKLNDPIVKLPGEYEFLGGKIKGGNLNKYSQEEVEEPYVILYTIPCEYGEKFRILHIMNSRVISHISNNDLIPADYYFKIRIPKGEGIKSINLVSPDFYDGNLDPDRDGIADSSYSVNVTERRGDIQKEENYWDIEGDYIKIKVPHVIAYSAVMIEFTPMKYENNRKNSQNTANKLFSSKHFQLKRKKQPIYL
jgi:hypothetical protein